MKDREILIIPVSLKGYLFICQYLIKMIFLIGLATIAFLAIFLLIKYFRSSPYDSLPEMTLAELAKHTGSGKTSYIGVGPYVFDVSSSEMYKPGGNYSVFAGNDATVALARMSLKPEDLNIEADLTSQEQKTLNEWAEFYKTKKNYPIIARLIKKPKSS